MADLQPSPLLSVLAAVLTIGIGGPVGYLSTAPRREALPVDKIVQLHATPPTLSIRVVVIVPSLPKEISQRQSLQEKLHHAIDGNRTGKDSPLHYDVTEIWSYEKALASNSSQAISACQLERDIHDCALILDSVTKVTATGDERASQAELTVILLSSGGRSSGSKTRAFSRGTSVVIFDGWADDTATITPRAADLVRVLSIADEDGSLHLENNNDPSLSNANLHYHLVFALLDESSATNDPLWNIDSALKNHLFPFLTALDSVLNVTVSSQIIHRRSGLPVPVHDTTGRYYVPASACHKYLNFLNIPRAHLPATATQLTFLLYVPHPDVSPLELRASKASHGFEVPGRGGVHVLQYNGSAGLAAINTDSMVRKFVAFLRHHFDVPRISAIHTLSPPGLDNWEINRLRRRISARSVQSAVEALVGVQLMTARIGTLEISPQVAASVATAVDALEGLSAESSAQGMLSMSRRAHTLAQSAFTNPAMLPLLDFPEDQMYAVYVPYVVPVCVALVGGLARAFRSTSRSTTSSDAKPS